MPALDLGTVRRTLTYIRDDIARVPGMERAADLLGSVIAEVDTAGRRHLVAPTRSLIDARGFQRRGH